jgi:hypothetical protein
LRRAIIIQYGFDRDSPFRTIKDYSDLPYQFFRQNFKRLQLKIQTDLKSNSPKAFSIMGAKKNGLTGKSS